MTAPVAPMEARTVRPWEMRLAEAMQEFQRDPGKRTLLEFGGLKARALSDEIADWRALAAASVAQPALPKLPSTPLEVTSFIGDKFDEWKSADSVEDYRYTISVHDLLSCFQNLADFAEEQPAQATETVARFWNAVEAKNHEMQPAQQVEAVGQVTDGWKLVPEDPTAEMYRAAAKIDNEMFAGGSSHGAEDGQVWAAMYDAAPNSTQLEAQQAGDVALKAVKFADHIINGMFEGGDWDGWDVQELAVKYGLLEQQTMQGPCNEDGGCSCVQNGAEFPSICYRKTYSAIAQGRKA